MTKQQALVLTQVVMMLVTSTAFAGTQQLVAPVADVQGMVMGVVVNVGTLAIILGVLAKVWAAHLPGGAEAVVNKGILLGLIAQTPRLVGLMGVAGALV